MIKMVLSGWLNSSMGDGIIRSKDQIEKDLGNKKLREIAEEKTYEERIKAEATALGELEEFDIKLSLFDIGFIVGILGKEKNDNIANAIKQKLITSAQKIIE